MILSAIDITVVVAYLLGTIAIGLYAGGKGSTTSDYFLAGRNIPQWAIGMTLMGPAWSEGSLITYAHAYEQATKQRRTPSLAPTVQLSHPSTTPA